MSNAQDIAKLADVIASGNAGANTKLEALKSELLARFSGAAPGGPLQFAHAATPSTSVRRRRISPYEAGLSADASIGAGAGSGARSSTFAPFFSGLSPDLKDTRTGQAGSLLVDLRVDDDADDASGRDGAFQSALERYEAAQARAASLGVASALVQTALASFKRLTQGQ